MTTELEVRMTIKILARKGTPNRAIARQLGMSEGNVRYHLKRIAADQFVFDDRFEGGVTLGRPGI